MDRSTSDGLSGRGGNWVDRTASQATGRNQTDKIRHLAKARVVGSSEAETDCALPIRGSRYPPSR